MANLLRSKARKMRGQGILEVLAMCTVILIPVALMFMDALALVAAKQIGVSSAQSIARAMAAEGTFRKANAVWNRSLRRDVRLRPGIILLMVHQPVYGYVRQGKIGVLTNVIVRLPVPIPGIPEFLFLRTLSVQPIAGAAPSENKDQFVVSYFS